ncbi:uncharacterized protein Z518_08940 [Rhinocladiella mackenziei CBS 650.93]|uniref:Uncharacterized protein n=1 Tax=Rhinocladiella mackenziei CBS 650.93 TaxID=1442369 RepID=A0A0D2IX86_9EURO|nr:uncharacterized protein Z518_08940 [Rhinocladiella mackenziei CBS 650.93]KIX01215.1 hypothetical protein Z518_08940 [Rhinocladiella mackenziei CBS 650.93]
MSSKEIYFNLPSTSLPASVTFISALGLNKRSGWPADHSQCFVFREGVGIFYHDHKTYKPWLPENVDIADAKRVCGCIITLTADSKAAVDDMINKAIEAGGSFPIIHRSVPALKAASAMPPTSP